MNEFGRNTGFRHNYLVIDNLCDFLQFRSQSYLTTFYFKNMTLYIWKKDFEKKSFWAFLYICTQISSSIILFKKKNRAKKKKKSQPIFMLPEIWTLKTIIFSFPIVRQRRSNPHVVTALQSEIRNKDMGGYSITCSVL